MKQFLLTLGGLFALAFTTYAQITINADDITPMGVIADQTTDTLPDASILPGDLGLQSWDFSSLKDQRPGTFTFILPEDTPYSDLFPDANLASLLDTIAYIYLNMNDDRIEVLGTYGIVDFQGAEFEVKVDLIPAQSLIRFPATFNDSYTETVDQVIQVPGSDVGAPFDSVRNITTIDRSVNIDAYGEMTTPTGTFETIRSTETEISVSRSYILNGGAWTLVDEGQPDSTINYNWWTNQNGLGFPLIQLGYDPQNDQSEVTWLKTITTGTKETFSLKVGLYPNPSSDLINIELPQDMEGNFEVFDFNGRFVLQQPFTNQFSQINLAKLNAGTYLLIVKNDRGRIEGFRQFEVVK